MRFLAENAWVDGGIERDVLIEIVDGRFTRVQAGAGEPATRLGGVVLPGLSNAHSHAFHRVLRGRTHGRPGSFWTWRAQMYEVAGQLQPDSYFRLAKAVYGEMALAGITCVGEFHYLHHRPDGRPYDDPNAMGHALIEAARAAGIRITLLDALYLKSSVDGKAPHGVQWRFSDGSWEHWRERVARLRAPEGAKVGAAYHSVRAVPEEALLPVDGPLHIHLSEQREENEACLAVHRRTPTDLLRRCGVLGPGTTVVHATHLADEDIAALAGTGVCLCPTTERDLADGIGPVRALTARSPLSLGSDSHAVIDLFEEARVAEMHERLATERRGHFTPAELIAAATNHAALGWDDAGRIAVGQRADLVAVRTDSVRTAGVAPDQVIYAATPADITDVVVDGRHIVSEGRHTGFDVAEALRDAVHQ
ncbi:MAG TPA: formimidoylglutamate deiminase [Actinoplanes sp.]|nr:formimidoylglutamate deiminase [Actinoplanes sp.]